MCRIWLCRGHRDTLGRRDNAARPAKTFPHVTALGNLAFPPQLFRLAHGSPTHFVSGWTRCPRMCMSTITLPRSSQEMPIPSLRGRPVIQPSRSTEHLRPQSGQSNPLPPLPRRPNKRRLPYHIRRASHRSPLHWIRRSNRWTNQSHPSIRLRPALRQRQPREHERTPQPDGLHRRLGPAMGSPRGSSIPRPHRAVLHPAGRLQRYPQRARATRRGRDGR